MTVRTISRCIRALCFGVLLLAGAMPTIVAKEILISDRVSNSVLRYTTSGTFIAPLLTDSVNLNQPAGIAVSPDLSKLFVTSTLNGRVVQYDYNYAAGTATNPQIWASGLVFPNYILPALDNSKVYVSTFGSGLRSYNPDGSGGATIPANVASNTVNQFAGLAIGPTGELLVGGFQNNAGTSGAVAKSNAGITAIGDFIAPTTTLNGVGNLLVNGNELYVTAGFAGRINKYDATTGAVDAGFTPVTGLAFPSSMILAPDGNGILVGVLGISDGSGSVTRFSFTGDNLGVFAEAQPNNATGFREATGMLVVPEPSGLLLVGVGLVGLCLTAWRRRNNAT